VPGGRRTVGVVGWWQRTPWADRNKVGVRLAWANLLLAFVFVLALVVAKLL
jgi:hypothetical protein